MSTEIHNYKLDKRLDLRTEVLIERLIFHSETSYLEAVEQVKFNHLGVKKRAFRTEIEAIKYNHDDEELLVGINRTSIYDQLPEVLFHSPKVKNDHNLNSIKEEFQKLKREEKQARLFFSPFDNELTFALTYNQLVAQQNESLELMKKIWSLPNHFSQSQKQAFWKFMPYLRYIRGNEANIEEYLSCTLGAAVTLSFSDRKMGDATKNTEPTLGGDFTLLGPLTAPGKQVNVKFMQPDNWVVTSMYKSSDLMKTLEYLVDLVLPADLFLNVLCDEPAQKLQEIGVDENAGILGFSLYI